jgi:hypothetical protein
MTAIREALEDRLTLAFAEVDLDSMSSSWSLEKAAETLSVEIALQSSMSARMSLATLRTEQAPEPLESTAYARCQPGEHAVCAVCAAHSMPSTLSQPSVKCNPHKGNPCHSDFFRGIE